MKRETYNWYLFTFLVLASSMLFCAEISESDPLLHNYWSCAEQLHRDGNNAQAEYYYKQVLEHDPHHIKALFFLGGLAVGKKDFTTAVSYYQKIVAVAPSLIPVRHNLALCYEQMGDLPVAIRCLEEVLVLDPDHKASHIRLGQLYTKQRDFTKAQHNFEHMVHQEPNNAQLRVCLGNALKECDQFEKALEQYRHARLLQPDDTSITFAFANMLTSLDRYHESLPLYAGILKKQPTLHTVLYNFGFTLKKMGLLEEAEEAYQRVLALQPDYAPAHFSLSSIYLQKGDFERGLQEHEWRWQAYNEQAKKFSSPIWDGSPLRDKTILVYAEQGMGDTLQFIRYAKLLKQNGARVIFLSQRPLAMLLSRCPYIDSVITAGDPVPFHDTHIALMSLPYICKTRLDTIPADVPYIYPDLDLVQSWHEKLSTDTQFKIGICWQGNSQYKTVHLRRAVAEKSVSAHQFVPLCQVPGVSLYSLQKMNGTDQLHDLDESIVIHEFDHDFDELHGRFMDTAAVMKNLDLVITVDTSIAHLAGALGVPVWVLLAHRADWRWFLNRSDTPWYPTMRLFRQSHQGDWDGLIEQIVQALQAIIGTSGDGSHARLQESVIQDTAMSMAQQVCHAVTDNTPDGDVAELLDKEAQRIALLSGSEPVSSIMSNNLYNEKVRSLLPVFVDINKQLVRARCALSQNVGKACDETFLNELTVCRNKIAHLHALKRAAK